MRDRKARAPRIEPEAVVRAALEILDADGLDHITLREISSRLGVQAPALYWHFKNKRDIIDDMAQAILVQGGLEEIKRPADPAAWAGWLIETARALRGAIVSYRDGGRVVAGASFRAKTLARIAILTTRVLNEAGFDLLHATLAGSTVFDYVWGYVIEEQAGIGPEPGPEVKGHEIASFGPYVGLDPADQKLLEDIVKEADRQTDTENFDWGLRAIVSGLELAFANNVKDTRSKS
jgi:TetR/AcrR family transcriptional regulator, tetracycline repressor protein